MNREMHREMHLETPGKLVGLHAARYQATSFTAHWRSLSNVSAVMCAAGFCTLRESSDCWQVLPGTHCDLPAWIMYVHSVK
jgi:hypothetical protein